MLKLVQDYEYAQVPEPVIVRELKPISTIKPVHFRNQELRYGRVGMALFMGEGECNAAKKIMEMLNGWEYYQAVSFLDRVKNALAQTKLDIPADFVQERPEPKSTDGYPLFLHGFEGL